MVDTVVHAAGMVLAAVDGHAAINQVLDLIKWGVGIFGGFQIIWGAIKIGTGLQQRDGNETSLGMWTLVGGSIIVLAVSFFAWLTA